MARWVKILCAAVCSFAVLFSCVGYAAVSGNLSISGSAEYIVDLPDIYIVSATPVDANVGNTDAYSETMLATTSKFTNGKNSAVIYEIKVANTTQVDYGYLMTSAITDDTLGAGNGLITYSVYTDKDCTNVMPRATILPPSDSNGDGVWETDKYLTFYLKISPIEATTTSATTYLNFQFVTPISDIPTGDRVDALAANRAMTRFAEILNDPTAFAKLNNQLETGGNANERTGTLLRIINALIILFGGTALSSEDFIAYVPDTIAMMDELGENADAKVCQDLFGNEELTLNIDGVDQNVYFAIVAQDLTGDQVDEYILYMTTNKLDTSGATATVYAGVFTSYTNTSTDSEGNQTQTTAWYQLGDMFTGQADVCTYTQGSIFSNDKTGSFEFYGWTSTIGYYGAATGSTVATIVRRPANSTDAFLEQLTIARNILAGKDVELEDGTVVNIPASELYTADTLANLQAVYTQMKAVYDNVVSSSNSEGHTQAQIVSYTRYLNEALVALKVL